MAFDLEQLLPMASMLLNAVERKVERLWFLTLQVSSNTTQRPEFLTQSNKRFSKNSRLLKRADFLKFFSKETKKFRGRAITIYQIKNSDEQSRMGITIKTKMTSVARNKLKRLIREWFRNNQVKFQGKELNIVIPNSISFSADTIKTIDRDLKEIEEELTRDNAKHL